MASATKTASKTALATKTAPATKKPFDWTIPDFSANIDEWEYGPLSKEYEAEIAQWKKDDFLEKCNIEHRKGRASWCPKLYWCEMCGNGLTTSRYCVALDKSCGDGLE